MEVAMRSRLLFPALIIALSSGFALAQVSIDQPFSFKDLIFSQVAAGGGLESLLTVHNSGTSTYEGPAHFRTGETAAQWNPAVNGAAITNGQFSLTVPPGKTASFLITTSGGAQTGGMIITAGDLDLTNYLEGNLTYFIKSGGQVIDSIGVLPSTPLVVASLPFENFSSIALAGFNADFQGRTANVTLNLYSENNTLLSTTGIQKFIPGAHVAGYLSDIFDDQPITRGRVEILSDIPFCGTAMTETASHQFSSLPLGSTIRTYSVNTQGVGVSMARIALSTSGIFVNGYIIAERLGNQELFLTYGQVSGTGGGQTLNLHFDGNSAITSNSQIFGFIKINSPFSWGNTTLTGNYYVAIPGASPGSNMQAGTFTATLIQ
jgi:hypothetical protein